ncbi:MAG: hypothetical protein QGH06_07185, partial [Lutibacter sp.]|nr:hypothetical protein [Lutibacter sp.]
TAGLPHVIMRFFTVPSVKAARSSAGWALVFIAILYTTAPAVAAMARLNLYRAVEMTLNKGKEAIASFADGDEQRMMLMGLKRFTKYANLPNPIALRKVIAEKVIAENRYCF